MKTKLKLFQARMFCAVALGIGSSFSLAAAAGDPAGPALTKTSIPWSQIGAKAGTDYQGGLAVMPATDGARLRCVFQRLEGEATREGLWLTSTVIPPRGTVSDRFRIVVTSVGRQSAMAGDERVVPMSLRESSARSAMFLVNVPGDSQAPLGVACDDDGSARRPMPLLTELERDSVGWPFYKHGAPSGATAQVGRCEVSGLNGCAIADTGAVSLDGQSARFTRPGLVEEYSVSMDGVRQDFIIEQRPVGVGPLRVELDVAGAKVEPTAGGAQLVLENSGRKIAYSRLRVTDATGKELTARMEVSDCRDAFHRVPIVPGGEQGRGGTRPNLVVAVNDAEAVYPVRIDPTFSDAKWSSMNPGVPGTDGSVEAAVVDDSGNLYIGGSFSIAGNAPANNIAKWDGSSWSALGSGIGGGYVSALAVSGCNVYAGGFFTTAGGSAATNIAKWDGSNWTALGSGMSDPLFVGANASVNALAVSGSDLYAGGDFTTAGGFPATNIAKWDGSSWSALGSGIGGGYVSALAASGSDLYAGGEFETAGGSAATNIAKWDGSSWSALGSGIGGNPEVYALAVSGSDLYAGGRFATAGGSTANSIAKWDGTSWSAMGSGMNDVVFALAVSGSDLYAGGGFTTAGGKVSPYIARAYLPTLPTLSVLRSGVPQGGIMVSWPSIDTASFALEQAGTLVHPPSWVTNAASITDDGTNKSVTPPATNSAQFFRLRRP